MDSLSGMVDERFLIESSNPLSCQLSIPEGNGKRKACLPIQYGVESQNFKSIEENARSFRIRPFYTSVGRCEQISQFVRKHMWFLEDPKIFPCFGKPNLSKPVIAPTARSNGLLDSLADETTACRPCTSSPARLIQQNAACLLTTPAKTIKPCRQLSRTRHQN